MLQRSSAPGTLLVANVKPVGFGLDSEPLPIDILIGQDGRVLKIGNKIHAPTARRIDAGGAWISPGWTDLHAHVWRGGTDISVDPSACGLPHGVTTIVDAGSAGEANFAGFREFIIEPARERIKAFLNLGSIGLTASRQLSELVDMRSIDIDRIMQCVEQNRDVIAGIKIRASGAITGGWGITPVKIAKRIAKILKLPVMAHVGEPPPLIDEVLAELGPGDVVTHCFNGKYAGSIIEDDELFAMVQRCAGEGIRLDVGHGGASFSFRTARIAIERGLLPFSISTDVHARSIEGKVWDLATTMSKILALGMPFDKVIEAVTIAPNSVIDLPTSAHLDIGAVAEFTIFDLVDSDQTVIDSGGQAVRLNRMIEPRWTVVGAEQMEASRHKASAHKAESCPHCGGQ